LVALQSCFKLEKAYLLKFFKTQFDIKKKCVFSKGTENSLDKKENLI
jgi:hypothetical protein